MTRDSDVLVPLQERTRIANESGREFVCFDPLQPRRSRRRTPDLEAYFLSPGATDKAAASVARQENSVVGLEVNKEAIATSRLSEVLASMAVGNFINESSKFASMICRHVCAKKPPKTKRR